MYLNCLPIAIEVCTLQDPYGVTIGGVIGHSICTAIAVIGGKLIAQKISTKTVTILGGLVFLLFSFTALLTDPNGDENSYTS